MRQENATSNPNVAPVVFRSGGIDDLRAIHRLYLDCILDLTWRLNIPNAKRTVSDQERDEDLKVWGPVMEYLTHSGNQFWIAERAGQPIGYSRSILRDGVRELTEFFVSPQAQSDGIGRMLLERALPPGARRTYIMASIDLRAQALYHKAGAYQVCAVYTFSKKVKELAPSVPVAGDIAMQPITSQSLPQLADLDRAIHGHRRDVDHEWLMAHRAGFLLMCDRRATGYGYIGDPFSGPFALLDAADYPLALAHAETVAQERGFDTIGLDVPMLNRTAIDYLLRRGYQMSEFFCFYMCSDKPPHVGNTIITGPMIMI